MLARLEKHLMCEAQRSRVRTVWLHVINCSIYSMCLRVNERKVNEVLQPNSNQFSLTVIVEWVHYLTSTWMSYVTDNRQKSQYNNNIFRWHLSITAEHVLAYVKWDRRVAANKKHLPLLHQSEKRKKAFSCVRLIKNDIHLAGKSKPWRHLTCCTHCGLWTLLIMCWSVVAIPADNCWRKAPNEKNPVLDFLWMLQLTIFFFFFYKNVLLTRPQTILRVCSDNDITPLCSQAFSRLKEKKLN